ncbi:MAG: hypothetical protein GY747_07635 [Planctomycetes bacterium]|nr:hypothetical protein [Planctomycetota bacterium]MCP4771029.1 hypothetical protein [Planctomycetota bacterium]MCP4861748.1 hypothetical protein [Planctomycetota bacterium]
MNILSLLPKIAWTSLLLGGAMSLMTDTGWMNTPVTPDLSQLEDFGPVKRNYEIEVDPAILGDFPPERFTFQSIAGPDGQEGRMYIAYYKRGRRWSGRPHDVNVCYRSMGFKELDAKVLKSTEGAELWSRVFQSETRTVRVVHWLQRPGILPGAESPLTSLKMMATPEGVRQDISSAYFEFDLEGAPSEEQLAESAQVVINQLEDLWK